jgi:hypothetical protein
MDFDPAQYGEADRRQVDPPVQVHVATLVGGRDGRLVGPRTPGMVRPRTRYGRKTAGGSKLLIFVPRHSRLVRGSSSYRPDRQSARSIGLDPHRSRRNQRRDRATVRTSAGSTSQRRSSSDGWYWPRHGGLARRRNRRSEEPPPARN